MPLPLLHRTRTTPHPRHRFPRPTIWVAAGLVVAALLWMLAAVPTLVKYPADLDATQHFEGTFTLLVDPETAAPLDEPQTMPLTVDRHVEAIESDGSTVVVRETIDQRAGDLLDTTQVNQYVMDRSTVQNVVDERAFAFEPAVVVDRSGAYRLHLPFDTDRSRTYRIYGNEIDGTYEIAADPEQPTGEVEGLDVSYFTVEVDEAPVTDAYLAELSKAVPLPADLTLDQMKPQLLAAGIDVDALLAALLPVLTPADTEALLAFAGERIGLEYVLSFGGRLAVEPVTGTEVQVSAEETLGVRPALGSLPVLLEVLGRYPDVPPAVDAVDALEGLVAGPPIALFAYEYDQTPASVAEIADEAASMRTLVLAAKVWVPLGLAGLALLSLLVGAVVYHRRRPRPLDLTSLWDTPAPAHPHEGSTEPSIEPTSERHPTTH